MFPILSKIIKREEWGAMPPRKRKAHKTPVQHMVITWTYTDPCETKEECIKAVQEIQKDHLERGANDIQYNFLVGGDGNIYEGRGWKYATHYPRETNPDQWKEVFKNNSIQVAFINRPSNKPTYSMLKGIATIFAIGEEEKYLVKNVKYSRIAYNEVMSFTF
ncbi:peptidoglycan-recognition protein SB2-like isoform X2 [Macrosteles quadrilineatus]|nr:peptidoglycan-recognition protein SB2-like isoform X2 [Macrosteles quadrilineatus]